MSFEEKFSLFIRWCDANKERSVENGEEYWTKVARMMSELSLEFDEYEEHSDIITSYILYLEKYYKKLCLEKNT